MNDKLDEEAGDARKEHSSQGTLQSGRKGAREGYRIEIEKVETASFEIDDAFKRQTNIDDLLNSDNDLTEKSIVS